MSATNENNNNDTSASINGNAASLPTDVKTIELPHSISVRQLADLLKVNVVDTIKQLMKCGVMANINQVIDYDAASLVAANFGFKAQPQPQSSRKTASIISEIKKQQLLADEGGNLKPRPPVITIMGHAFRKIN